MDESNLINYLFLALVFYLGYKLGQHVTALRVTRMLIDRDPHLESVVERARRELRRQEAQTDPQHEEELRVERHGDQLFLYAKDSNEFLAQGSDLEEAIGRVEQRFPDRKFQGRLSKEQAAELGVSVK